MSRVTRDTCHDSNAQSPGVTRPRSQVSRLRRVIIGCWDKRVRVLSRGKNGSAMMNKYSTETDEGCLRWGGLCHPVSIWDMQRLVPCLSHSGVTEGWGKIERDPVMIVALCDMTEVSSLMTNTMPAWHWPVLSWPGLHRVLTLVILSQSWK